MSSHAHTFRRRPFWWLHRVSWYRWECRCGFTTRTYDIADRWANRPIHPYMSVALPSYNTTKDDR
jgi:hypothetical protein